MSDQDDERDVASIMAGIGWALLWGSVAVMFAALLGWL
jgi:hypothetical protein